MRRAFFFGILLLALLPARAGAQDGQALRISTAVVPDTVTVGDPFRSVLRVEGEFEAIEFFPVPVGDTIQPVDTLEATGGETPTAVYTLVAWQTGDDLQARLPMRVLGEDGEFVTYTVSLRLPVVRSVLPEDTSVHLPRPHRAVLEDDVAAGLAGSWWRWLLLALALLVPLLVWLLRRRPPAEPEAVDARERALRELARLDEAGLVRPEEHRRLYPAATRVLREYLASVEPGWGTDLTTTELLTALALSPAAGSHREELARVLDHADAVKFARHVPDRVELDAFWTGIEGLVRRIPNAVEPAGREEVAA